MDSGPVRIAFVTTGLGVGGAETMLLRLLESLDRRRFAPTVICLSGTGPVAESLARIGVTPVILDQSPVSFPFLGIPRLVAALRRIRPHVVQGWMYHGNLAATLAMPFLQDSPALLWNIRMAGDDFETEKRLTRLVVHIGALLSSRARWIVTNSRKSALTHAVRHGYHSRWRVIPNGFDTEAFSPGCDGRRALAGLDLDGSYLLVGLVARYHAIKDHATFLAAAEMLARANARVRFVLVGEGMVAENAELSGWVDAHRLRDRVVMLGPRRDAAQLTAALDVATLSSISEGFPNVVGEAMSCGVPCVVTDVGDAALIVGDTGIVVRPRDPAAMSAAWSELLAMRQDQRRAVGLRARERIVANFSIIAVTRAYERLFDEAAAERLGLCAA